MKTGQLIVLWYAALIIVTIFLFKSLEGAHDNPYLIYAVITFAAALIYTMREHPRANKKVVYISVLMPLVTITTLSLSYLAWSHYQHRNQIVHLPKSQIELKQFRIARLPGDILDPEALGRIINLSEHPLKSVALRFRFTNGKTLSPQYPLLIEALIEPGEASDFNVPVGKQMNRFLDEPEIWTGFEVEVTEVLGIRRH